MTRKEKELKLKDLCARLPYGVKVKLLCRGSESKFDDWIEATLNTKDIEHFGKTFKNIKPYLRPMSSMTEEEKSLFLDLRNALTYQENGEYDLDDFNELQDFLNRSHFDWRGLIPMGLAIEVTEDNNPYK